MQGFVCWRSFIWVGTETGTASKRVSIVWIVILCCDWDLSICGFLRIAGNNCVVLLVTWVALCCLRVIICHFWNVTSKIVSVASMFASDDRLPDRIPNMPSLACVTNPFVAVVPWIFVWELTLFSFLTKRIIVLCPKILFYWQEAKNMAGIGDHTNKVQFHVSHLEFAFQVWSVQIGNDHHCRPRFTTTIWPIFLDLSHLKDTLWSQPLTNVLVTQTLLKLL